MSVWRPPWVSSLMLCRLFSLKSQIIWLLVLSSELLQWFHKNLELTRYFWSWQSFVHVFSRNEAWPIKINILDTWCKVHINGHYKNTLLKVYKSGGYLLLLWHHRPHPPPCVALIAHSIFSYCYWLFHSISNSSPDKVAFCHHWFNLLAGSMLKSVSQHCSFRSEPIK